MDLTSFANIKLTEQDAAFQQAAGKSGLAKIIIEKDFWVCWSLKQLFSLESLNGKIVFKGGTSLSKAFNLIDRFSEDVDLSLARSLLDVSQSQDPLDPEMSGKTRKTVLKKLNEATSRFVYHELLPELERHFNTTLKHNFELQVAPDDPQTILFSYPKESTHDSVYVKPKVRLEFGTRGAHLPSELRQIRPTLFAHFPDIFSDSPVSVTTLSAERTFWEKATILHMLAHQGQTKPLGDRMSRHYYDLFKLIQHSELRQRTLEQTDLLEEVARHKAVYFRSASARYELAKPGSLQLSPGSELREALERDYSDMSEMFFEASPPFKEILETISQFENDVNRLG